MSPAGGLIFLSVIFATSAAYLPSRQTSEDLQLLWFDPARESSFDPPQVEPPDAWVSKRALSALSRWRPLTEGFRSMLGYNGGNSADGVPDFVSAETRGLSPGRPVQPLRWGRRRR